MLALKLFPFLPEVYSVVLQASNLNKETLLLKLKTLLHPCT